MTLGNAELNALERIATAVEDGVEIQPGEAIVITPGTYLGQQVIAGNDANQNATIPNGTKTIWVMAEGGAVGCTVNGTSASLAAAGYHIPENNIRLIGPFGNITSLGVFAATGDNAHLIYES